MEKHAGRFSKDLFGFFGAYVICELGQATLGMPIEYWDSNASGTDSELGKLENLTGLKYHLVFFLGEVVILEDIDVR